MKKKFLGIMVAATFAFALAGCGGEATDGTESGVFSSVYGASDTATDLTGGVQEDNSTDVKEDNTVGFGDNTAVEADSESSKAVEADSESSEENGLSAITGDSELGSAEGSSQN